MNWDVFWDLYYNLNTTVRVVGFTILGCGLLKATGMFFRWGLAVLLLALAGSMVIFFLRNYLPDEWEFAMRMFGVTVQMVAVVGAVVLYKMKKFD